MKNFIIAIDGPAGSGKSTTARLVAQRLNALYVDTGAMYRVVTLDVLRKRVDVNDEPGVATVAHACAIAFEKHDDEIRVLLNGEDVSALIRSAEVTKAVSVISSYAAVRKKMVELQRGFAESAIVVMDGRDIGTVVFPTADVKIFLTASLAERARRRRNETASVQLPLEEIERRLAERDELDSVRAISPLRKAEDAVEIDTTRMTIVEQIEAVLAIVSQKIPMAQ